MVRKSVSLFILLLLLCGITCTAFADDETGITTDESVSFTDPGIGSDTQSGIENESAIEYEIVSDTGSGTDSDISPESDYGIESADVQYAAVSSDPSEESPGTITSVTLKYDRLTYTGKKRTQTRTTVVKSGENILVLNRDYSVSYKNNTSVGKAVMIVKGKGDYTGSIKRYFNIVKAPIKSASLSYKTRKWTGKALRPKVTVKCKAGGVLRTLKKNTDYTVTYKNNVRPGTASVIIKGKGSYRGTVKKTFRIKPIPAKELSAGDIVDESMIRGIEKKYFTSSVIKRGGEVFERINGKSYYDNPNVALSDLRYLKVLHYNFFHEIQVGEIIVHKSIAQDVIRIFKKLFRTEYEINSMYLIDFFWTGDPATTDDESCRFNNTSSFCYRSVTNGESLSRHAYGMAIDLNPQQNPYVWHNNGIPTCYHENAYPFVDRSKNDPHMIKQGDICYRTFIKYGFRWGGEWSDPTDYQHFER